MNCGLRYDEKRHIADTKALDSLKAIKAGKQVKDGNRLKTAKVFRTDRKRRWMEVFFAVLAASVCAWYMIYLLEPQRFQNHPRSNWEHLRGNDGKFWRGMPDNGVYADMEGVRIVGYVQYLYDEEGRLSQQNTFRRHDIYEDVWVLDDEEIYEYDSQGRISQRQAVQGSTWWTYDYTDSGYTKSCSIWSHRSKPDIYTYDLAGNLIFYRNATNYSAAHSTTFEYDERNRLVKKILEVEGNSPYVVLTAEYDDRNHTSVETEYGADGKVSHIWLNTYDENWEKTDSAWYAMADIPVGYAPEECVDYYTKGYWVYYFAGAMMAQMSNEPWSASRNNSRYTAFDYDSSGNCIMELNVYGVGYVHMDRYAYDSRNRLKEEFSYDFSDVTFWERQQSDGSRLTLQAGEDEPLSITRTAPDGTLINRFVYGEDEVEVQYTPEGTVYWQLSPAQLSGQGEPGVDSDVDKPEGDVPGQYAPGSNIYIRTR